MVETKRALQWRKLAKDFMQVAFQLGLHQNPHFIELIQRGNALIAWDELASREIIEPDQQESHDQVVS
jgi:hypothetical protein